MKKTSTDPSGRISINTMPKQQQSQGDIPSQFSDDEMAQVKRYGEALGGKPTPFDEEVEGHLAGMEANAKKMRAAMTGGGGGGDEELGPTEFEAQQAKQQGAMTQNQALIGARAAAQAQAAQTAPQAPPAPSGPQGVSVPYPAQKNAPQRPSRPGEEGPQEPTQEETTGQQPLEHD